MTFGCKPFSNNILLYRVVDPTTRLYSLYRHSKAILVSLLLLQSSFHPDVIHLILSIWYTIVGNNNIATTVYHHLVHTHRTECRLHCIRYPLPPLCYVSALFTSFLLLFCHSIHHFTSISIISPVSVFVTICLRSYQTDTSRMSV